MKTLDLGKVAIVPRGPYDAGTEYHPLDLVQYQGSSFLVKETVTGVTPSDGTQYMLLAQKGDTGPKGATGSSGSNATINGSNAITIEGQYGTVVRMSEDGKRCIIQGEEFSLHVSVAYISSVSESTYVMHKLITRGHLMVINGSVVHLFFWDGTSGATMKDVFGSAITCTITRNDDNYNLTVAFNSPRSGKIEFNLYENNVFS